MQWWLLQKNKCPDCESEIRKVKGEKGRRTGMTTKRECTNESCDFTIGIEKFAQIVGDVRQKQINKGRKKHLLTNK